jgi:hypothetical protein
MTTDASQRYAKEIPADMLSRDDADLLGPDIVSVINAGRLKGLPAAGKDYQGKVIFKEGNSDVFDLIQLLPSLTSRIEKKLSVYRYGYRSRYIGAPEDLKPVHDYRNDILALTRINSMIMRYLGIAENLAQPDAVNERTSTTLLR